MLDEEIARRVHAGKFVDEPWELFRVLHFPGRSEMDAVDELAKWCDQHNIEPTFGDRKVDAGSTTYTVRSLLLTPR
jgi:hypothetical protein